MGGVLNQMKKLSLLFILLLTITTGCNSDVAGGYDRDEDRDGTKLMSNRWNNDNGTTDMPGQTMSDQNPNLLNTDGGKINNGDDISKARQVVNQTNEFRAGSVWINGNHMWVTVYKKGMMADKEKINAESNVHQKLTQALPRYDIEVRVLEDRS